MKENKKIIEIKLSIKNFLILLILKNITAGIINKVIAIKLNANNPNLFRLCKISGIQE